MAKIYIAAIIGIALSSIGCDSPFHQEGYFKDKNRNRIMTYVFGPNEGDETIVKHATGLIFTEGRIFTVYYYPQKSVVPADQLTLAKSVLAAYAVIDNSFYSRPQYAVMRERDNGSVHLLTAVKSQTMVSVSLSSQSPKKKSKL